MPFRFPLETILRFRRSVEHQQELRLRSANQQVTRARHLIDQIGSRIAGMRLRQSGELTAGTTAAELHFNDAGEACLEQQRLAAEHELERLRHARDQQARIFHHARRARETFESLREQQRAEYERKARRREQRELDELFLLRRTPQPPG